MRKIKIEKLSYASIMKIELGLNTEVESFKSGTV